MVCRFLILILLAVVPLGSWAQTKVVVVTDLWPPFRIDLGFGSLGGIDVDLLGRIEKKMSLKFEVQRVPWARCLEMMRSGEADLMAGLAKTDERATYISFSKSPYFVVRPAFYTHRTRNLTIGTYADLANLSIGFTRGSAYFEPFDSDKSLKKVDQTQEEQLLDMLVLDRFDVLVGTDPQVDYDIRHRHLQDVVVKASYQPDSVTPLYMGISLKSPFLVRQKELETLVAGLVADGTVQALASRYF